MLIIAVVFIYGEVWLDEENKAFAPNLTSSRTGLTNPDAMLERLGISESCEAVYVTRTYVTKHGAGRLPYEEIFLANGIIAKIYESYGLFTFHILAMDMIA